MATTFLCDSLELLNALDRCNPVISESAAHNFSSLVLLEIGSSLGVHASDSSVTVCNNISAYNKEGDDVSVLVNHRAIKQWLAYSFDARGNIEFSFDGTTLTAKANNRRKANFISINDYFPNIFRVDGNEEIARLEGSDLTDAIGNIASLASPESYDVKRFVKFMLRGDSFEMMATDGFVFGYQRGRAKQVTKGQETLIDHRAFLAISSAVKNFDTVRIHRRKREGRSDVIFFVADGCYTYTQVSDDRYPDVKPFLSEDYPNKCLINKEEARRALLASRGFTKKDEGKPTLVCVDNGSLRIGSAKTERGSNVDYIEALQAIGSPIEVKANIDYWVNTLSRVQGVNAWLHLDVDASNVPKMVHITDMGGRQKFLIAPMR